MEVQLATKFYARAATIGDGSSNYWNVDGSAVNVQCHATYCTTYHAVVWTLWNISTVLWLRK